ncbi:hypothetical protein MUP32_04425 [Candidatus Microgenomates bacterium]|nr:hypothetical protein [Candidatus Microgenomates bacterium]
MEKLKSLFSTRKKRILIIGTVALVFLIIISLLLSSKKGQELLKKGTIGRPGTVTQSPGTGGGGQKILDDKEKIYFAKSIENPKGPNTVELYSVDPDGNNAKLQGKVEEDAKQIVPLSDNTYLYIGDLGFLDRGLNIYYFLADTGLRRSVYLATDGFQIESYILSPDKSALAVWEMSKGQVKSGLTQVVYQKVDDPNDRKVLFSEEVSDQVKYPIFWSKITDRIYLDSYSARMTGLYRGVFSVSTNDGLQPITGLGLDEYSSSPVISSDGRYLAYTAYNQKAKTKILPRSEKDTINREAVINPNEVKILNLETGEISTLVSDVNGTTFDHLCYSFDGKKLIYRSLTNTQSQTMPKQYSIIDTVSKKSLLFSSNTNGVFLKQFKDGTTLSGLRTILPDSLGGINANYMQVLDGIYLFNPVTTQYRKIISDDIVQIIGVN